MSKIAEQGYEGAAVGLDDLTDFLGKQYLDEYIPRSGSKIKFITGRQGSGKTMLAGRVMEEAEKRGFLTVTFSARDVWMHDFREIYLEILRQSDIEHILLECARRIIREMDYDPDQIEGGQNFLDYLSERGDADPISRGEIRSFLREYFTRNPMLDHNFACACSLITGGILGHPVLEEASRELLLGFLQGDKSVKLAQLRALGLSPSRVTKYNARNLLRSLAEVIHVAGYRGLVITIDDMEILLNRSAGEEKRYTKLRREDTYESIRQLIDDIDNMHYIMFLLCFDRELMDNENYGMKSYQALWMRIQNEVVSPRFNMFADILDMDRYADEFYNEDVLFQMAHTFADVLKKRGQDSRRPDRSEIRSLYEKSRFGGVGLPYLVYRAVSEKEEKHG